MGEMIVEIGDRNIYVEKDWTCQLISFFFHCHILVEENIFKGLNTLTNSKWIKQHDCVVT